MKVIETVDIVRDLVSNMKLKLKINTVKTVTGGFMITTCNTYYLQKGFYIVISGVKFKVGNVVINTSVVLLGTVTPLVGTFDIPSPYYFHGTVIQTNAELTMESDVFKKTPMVYLKRPFPDRFSEEESAVDRESDVTLFFLTQADFEGWKTEDHDKNAVLPMRNVAYSFVENLRKNTQIGLIEGYTMTDRIRFAVPIGDKGYGTQLWNDKLSGVQLDIKLPINKNYKCCSTI